MEKLAIWRCISYTIDILNMNILHKFHLLKMYVQYISY